MLARCNSVHPVLRPNGTDWPAVLTGLPSLRTLYLNNNPLTYLPNTSFAQLTNLSDIRLNNCLISELPESHFYNNTKITDIRLSGNFLRSIPDGYFKGLPVLYQVYMNNNLYVWRATSTYPLSAP